jgi:hypothetical protein
VCLLDIIQHRKVAYLLNKKCFIASKRNCYRLLAGYREGSDRLWQIGLTWLIIVANTNDSLFLNFKKRLQWEKTMNKMYKLSALLTSLIGLSGCINGETVANNITGRVVSVDGTWLSNCVVEGAISSKTTIINTNGTGNISEQTYSDTTCTTTSMLEGAEYTYELLDAVTVDGTVDGITTATKINVTYTSGVVGSEFNIVAIKDTQVMYFGDGGTTDALRPAQLDGSLVYTRQ